MNRPSSSSSFSSSSSIPPLGFEDEDEDENEKDRVHGPDARFWNRGGFPSTAYRSADSDVRVNQVQGTRVQGCPRSCPYLVQGLNARTELLGAAHARRLVCA